MGEATMSKTLQSVIDTADCGKYDAILLCYGLCNNGIAGLHAPVPMVVPRAHDCITLLLGSKEKYAEYFADNPGTYFHSSGWQERNLGSNEIEGGIMQQLGLSKSYQEYADAFGDENAEYLMSILGSWVIHYKKLAFINNGIGDIENNREKAKDYAQSNGWAYEELEGGISLIERLVDGEWDEPDFLLIPPGHRIAPSNDSGIVTCNPV